MPDVTIKMNTGMVTSANYVLSQREIKGSRKEMREHKRIMSALLAANSAEEEVVMPNGQKTKQKIVKEAPLTLEKSDWENLYAYCEERVKSGFPASLNEGLDDLMTQIEDVAKVSEDPEKDEASAENKITPIKPKK